MNLCEVPEIPTFLGRDGKKSALKPDRIVFGEIHHPQWRLQPATVELRSCTMLQASGIELSNSQPLCHFSRLQEVVAWPIVPIEHAEI